MPARRRSSSAGILSLILGLATSRFLEVQYHHTPRSQFCNVSQRGYMRLKVLPTLGLLSRVDLGSSARIKKGTDYETTRFGPATRRNIDRRQITPPARGMVGLQQHQSPPRPKAVSPRRPHPSGRRRADKRRIHHLGSPAREDPTVFVVLATHPQHECC